MRDARRLEPPSPVEPEDAGRGETQILIAGGIGGTEIRGAPEIHSTDPLKDARREETRRSIAGTAERTYTAG